MPRRVSAISCAALVTAALLSGCGGGHAVHTSSSDARARSSPATSATTATGGALTLPASRAYWPYAKLVERLVGRTLALPRGRTIHLQSALLECNGEGAAVKSGPARRWSRYTCTQTLFQNGVDRDVTFDVMILSPTRLSITSPRFGPS